MLRGATLFAAIGVTLAGGVTCSASARAAGAAAAATARTGVSARGARAGAEAPGTRKARAARPAPGRATKRVSFDGYMLTVPAGWPVYRLDRDPARCVRYNRHAVYLGTPGPAQDCPAHLVGRVATISVQAAPSQGGAARWWPGQSGPPASGPMWHAPDPGTGVGRGPLGAGEVVRQDSQDQVLRALVSAPDVAITATYSGSPSQVAGVLRSLRRAARGAGAPAAGASGAASPAGAPARPARASAGHSAAPPARLAAARGASGPDAAGGMAAAARQAGRLAGHVLVGRMKGFDTCAAPSLSTMRRLRPLFGAVAIYIGGPEAACGYGNLSPSWVRSVLAAGWSLIPAYVGPQAPCSQFHDRIKIGHARAGGQQAARDAIRLASSLGLRRGAPLYDDMEAYNSREGICRRQVLSFLNGWDRELRARGYTPGVYSSAASGARDLGRARRVYGQWLVKPQTMWFALWNGHANLRGAPYLGASWWPAGHRIKQYQGNHRLRVSGATLSIDSDMVDGSVYR